MVDGPSKTALEAGVKVARSRGEQAALAANSQLFYICSSCRPQLFESLTRASSGARKEVP